MNRPPPIICVPNCFLAAVFAAARPNTTERLVSSSGQLFIANAGLTGTAVHDRLSPYARQYP